MGNKKERKKSSRNEKVAPDGPGRFEITGTYVVTQKLIQVICADSEKDARRQVENCVDIESVRGVPRGVNHQTKTVGFKIDSVKRIG